MESVFRVGIGTIVEIRGRDRCKVLNNQATQDLRQLSDGQALETFITDPKGKAFGHGIAVGFPDSLWFVTVPDQASRLIPHLDRYIIMEDASLHDLSDQFELWISHSKDWLAPMLSSLPDESSSNVVRFEKGDARIFTAPWISSGSVLLATDALATQCLLETIPSTNWSDSNLTHRLGWERSRIENFWPWYGVDLDERNLPQEIDRDETAISFNKGCYLGQETIARLDALGQVQKKLVRIEVSSDSSINFADDASQTLFSDGIPVGTVRSISTPILGKSYGLAFVKRSHFASGTSLQLGESRADCTVL